MRLRETWSQWLDETSGVTGMAAVLCCGLSVRRGVLQLLQGVSSHTNAEWAMMLHDWGGSLQS